MSREEDGNSSASYDQVQPKAAPTLLPAPIASVVSLVTRSSALYLRLGSLIGGLAIDGARVTTLTGLELSRAVVEGILSKAGRDVSQRSIRELGRADAESLLERSIATLHSTITHISFAASAGFYLSSASLSSASDISQHLLAALDSILGSTDSSRAIASIITLIRREFENPATGQPGEKVGVVDLLTGICGLALLQRWCQKLADQESREKHYEEVIWDVVILDDGRRADVVGSSEPEDGASTDVVRQDVPTNGIKSPVSFITTSGEDRILEAVERRGQEDDIDGDVAETGLKERIMQTLPPDAKVSITTEVTTTKTITVEITGATAPDLSPPPGVEIVEENSHHTGEIDLDGEVLTNEQKIALLIPRYRVVYRIIQNKMRGTTVVAGTNPHESDLITDREMIDVSSPPKTSSNMGSVTPLESYESSKPKSSKKTFSLSPLSSPDPEEQPDTGNQLAEKTERPSQNDTDRTLDGAVEVLKSSPRNPANQKRLRKDGSASSSVSGSDNPASRNPFASKTSLPKKAKPEPPPKKAPEKKATLRNVLRKGSGAALSNLRGREQSPQPLPETKSSIPKPPWGSSRFTQVKPAPASLQVPQRIASIIPAREAPRTPQRGNPNHFSSRDLGRTGPEEVPRSPSRTSYYSIHQTRRDSIVSQTDTYSIHSTDTRPTSPTAFRTHVRTQNTLLRARSEKDVGLFVPPSPSKNHKRTRSHVPSIYTLRTNNSDTSLVLARRPMRSAFEDIESLRSLARTGHIDGLFPQHHLVRNMTRFIRFASASYGSHFMRIMGITSSPTTSVTTTPITANHHLEHHSFSRHTRLPPSTILLSSFADPQPFPDPTSSPSIIPLVHFISLDHDSRAVVLTCRGTLGFEDVLTDLTCDYDTLTLRGKAYKVHKGIYASALRLLSPSGSRILATIAAALEEFPSYGLVLCGHSLGGSVTALLAIMISEPSKGTAFVTSSTLQYTPPSNSYSSSPPHLMLPPSRPIHVYAYGPPSTLSPSLRLATRGLITTVINNQDLVPYLSLGTLHDLQAVSLAFQTDSSGAKGEVRARVWSMLAQGLADKWYAGREAGGAGEDDEWALSALKALRASMLSPKLVPPGEVFIVESLRVLKREVAGAGLGAVSATAGAGLGRPAVRAVLKYVRDVEARFGELRFGGSMLLDHSPGRYEDSLAALGKGVLG